MLRQSIQSCATSLHFGYFLHRSLLLGLLPGFFLGVAVRRCSSVFYRVVICCLYSRFPGWQLFIEGS